MVGEKSAREAYDRMAPVYDAFNEENDYEHWLGDVLLPEMEKHGLRVGRALDVGCGTGRAFEPLLSRGWAVFGVEPSAGMREQVYGKFPDLRLPSRSRTQKVALSFEDARRLPTIFDEGFDLILALNEVVNYLTEDGDLELFFEGVKRNLSPEGLVCFDANCLSLFEANWIAGREPEINERGWRWRGLTPATEPGGLYEVEVSGEGFEAHRHRERHWPRPEVEAAMGAAGLRVLQVSGHREDLEAHQIFLDPEPEEDSHPKLIYIGGHDD